MPDNDKKKQNIDASTEFVYKNEEVVNTGSIKSKDSYHDITVTTTIGYDDKSSEFSYTSSNSEPTFTFDNIRNIYSQNNNSVDATYNYLKEQIQQNPDKIVSLIGTLEANLQSMYDFEQHHKNIGNTGEEMLANILNCPPEQELDGFVCGTIHGFGMKLLHDCDIPAVLLCGKYSNSNHATLLYQTADGKFIYNNYGVTQTIEAPSLTDAIKTVYKQSGDLESCGYITLIDENNSYQMFAFEQEALWANELDKNDYNKVSPFTQTTNSNNTEISGRYEVSNLGNIEATATGNLVCGTEEKPRQFSASFGYRKNGETALFNNSNAVGIKLEYSGSNNNKNGNSTFFQTKAVVENIQGENFKTNSSLVSDIFSSSDFLNAYEHKLQELGIENTAKYYEDFQMVQNSNGTVSIEKSNNTSTFLSSRFGKKTNLVENDNFRLDNSGQISLNGGATFNDNAVFGDARVTIEDGFALTTGSNNWRMENSLSAGYVADLKLTSGEQKPGVQSGVKLNATTSFMAKPTERSCVVAEAEGHAVKLKPYQEYGFSSSLFGSYEIAPQKSIYGQLNYSNDVQRINIGGFSGKSSDKSVFGATVGSQLKNTNVYVTYNKSINGINKTYNNSAVAVGAKFNF